MTESEKKYYDLCANMIELLNSIHNNSRRYIRRTLWSMLYVPAFLILLMLITETSKPAIMFLWIASLFISCGFLIFLEYIDTRMLNHAKSLAGGEEEWLKILEHAETIRQEKAAVQTEAVATDEAATGETAGEAEAAESTAQTAEEETAADAADEKTENDAEAGMSSEKQCEEEPRP